MRSIAVLENFDPQKFIDNLARNILQTKRSGSAKVEICGIGQKRTEKNCQGGRNCKVILHKNEGCESIPHLKLLDKPAKKKRRRRELKETCLAISFVWLLGIALMSQAVIENDAIADAYFIMLVITAVLQAAGCR